MTTTDTPTLHIQGPADLLSAVPYLLGFHPHESLVLIGLADATLVVTARLDLTDAEACLGDTVEVMVRGGTTQLVGAIFTDIRPDLDTALRHVDVIGLLVREAERAGADLVDCLLVTGDRWWSYTCRDSACCPAEGTAMPSEPTLCQVRATYAGMTVLPNRAALADMFAPIPDRPDLTDHIVQCEDVELTAALSGTRTRGIRAVIRALFVAHRAARAAQSSLLPTDNEVARYGVALQSYAVRDALWIGVDDGRLEGIELWVNLARRLPDPYAAAPLFLAGWSAYRDGNGAVAAIAAELAVAADHGYSAADLLLTAVTRGVDPRRLPKLRAPKGDTDTAG